MPKPYPSLYQESGRPLVKINWDEIDAMIIAGSPVIEISDLLGIDPSTFYKRVIKDKGVDFSTYHREKKTKGDALLRLAQFKKAIGKTKEGDTQLLIHLGKHRLGQVDKTEVDTTFTFVENDPTKRESNTDTIQVPMPPLPGSDVELPEEGV